MLIAAYGMLFSFPFQGYGPVSIAFSTMLIIAGLYACRLIYIAGKTQPAAASWSFLKAGFFYLLISSIAPFLTGPLIASGKSGSPLYFNVIYFFLHFQYNGFFIFVVLAVLYKNIERYRPQHNGKNVFLLMNIACGPSYLLSILWAKPAAVFYLAGGAAALLQVIAVLFLLKDAPAAGLFIKQYRTLFRIAIAAFVMKNVLQLLSAFPAIAELAYLNRNFIIAYLHLVLLGFISAFSLVAMINIGGIRPARVLSAGLFLFLLAFISTELLLILQPFGSVTIIPYAAYPVLLFACSVLFPAGLTLVGLGIARSGNFL